MIAPGPVRRSTPIGPTSIERSRRTCRNSATFGTAMPRVTSPDRNNASTPAAHGVAMLVPDIWVNPPPGRADQMLTPGPELSIFAPAELKVATFSDESRAAMLIASRLLPGASVCGVFGPLLPPANVSQTPASAHSRNLRAVVWSIVVPPPHEQETTWHPSDRHHSIAFSSAPSIF